MRLHADHKCGDSYSGDETPKAPVLTVPASRPLGQHVEISEQAKQLVIVIVERPLSMHGRAGYVNVPVASSLVQVGLHCEGVGRLISD